MEQPGELLVLLGAEYGTRRVRLSLAGWIVSDNA